MLVKHILQEKGRDVVSVPSTATISEVARILAARRIGVVLVHDAGDRLAGILSERDIVGALAARSVNALADSVATHMTRRVTTCHDTDHIEDIMALMTRKRFRHVPVLEGERVIGIVSIGDIVKTRIVEAMQEAETLRTYIAAG